MGCTFFAESKNIFLARWKGCKICLWCDKIAKNIHRHLKIDIFIWFLIYKTKVFVTFLNDPKNAMLYDAPDILILYFYYISFCQTNWVMFVEKLSHNSIWEENSLNKSITYYWNNSRRKYSDFDAFKKCSCFDNMLILTSIIVINYMNAVTGNVCVSESSNVKEPKNYKMLMIVWKVVDKFISEEKFNCY